MFSSLIGNQKVKENLARLSASGRVPNALLFAGAGGVGKKLFAFELARMLICPEKGCGECPVCKRIGVFDIPKFEKGDDTDKVFLSDHPDVGIVLPYKRNLRVGAIRALESESYFRPFEAERRVFVIDDAEKMNDSSSNALLKTLEEPPATTHLILVTSRPDSLLPTIRSRCQTIRFAPVELGAIEEYLVASGKFSQEDAVLAARVSGGSIANAVNLDIAWFRSVRAAMLGVLHSAVVTGDLAQMLQTSEQLNDAKNKERFEETIEILQTLVHDIFALSKGAAPDGITNADVAGQLAELAETVNSVRPARWALELEELLGNLAVNVNRKVATDNLFVSMAA